MYISRDARTRKQKYLFALMLLFAIAMICLAFSMGASTGSASSRREVLLRRIGHEVLLQSGDSTSRVLPVKKTGENEYQVSFENEFSFQPDSLLKITRRALTGDQASREYIVNVLNCGNSKVTYGFIISRNQHDDIITCLGRKQPRACYILSITFQPTKTSSVKNALLLGCLGLLACVGFIVMRTGKSKELIPVDPIVNSFGPPTNQLNQSAEVFTLGSLLFDAGNRKLVINDLTVQLTGTEARVLRIFAMSPNETIERGRLQKEIWEDEGVIVGRSLDMFISKLRKKLEPEPAVKIVVVRGKGYRLEIGG